MNIVEQMALGFCATFAICVVAVIAIIFSLKIIDMLYSMGFSDRVSLWIGIIWLPVLLTVSYLIGGLLT